MVSYLGKTSLIYHVSSSVQLLAVDSSFCWSLGLRQLHGGADQWHNCEITPPKQKETGFLAGLSLSMEPCSDMARSTCDVIDLLHAQFWGTLGCILWRALTWGEAWSSWHQWGLWVLSVLGDQNWGFQVEHMGEWSQELGTTWKESGLDVCSGFTPRYCWGKRVTAKHQVALLAGHSFSFSFFSSFFSTHGYLLHVLFKFLAIIKKGFYTQQ